MACAYICIFFFFSFFTVYTSSPPHTHTFNSTQSAAGNANEDGITSSAADDIFLLETPTQVVAKQRRRKEFRQELQQLAAEPKKTVHRLVAASSCFLSHRVAVTAAEFLRSKSQLQKFQNLFFFFPGLNSDWGIVDLQTAELALCLRQKKTAAFLCSVLEVGRIKVLSSCLCEKKNAIVRCCSPL